MLLAATAQRARAAARAARARKLQQGRTARAASYCPRKQPSQAAHKISKLPGILLVGGFRVTTN
jgi:septal ring factor EnvC (AmiA/AmiB activator)